MLSIFHVPIDFMCRMSSLEKCLFRSSARFLIEFFVYIYMGFHHSSVSKESACSAGDPGSIPGLGRSPGKGNGNPLQSSCLENCMDRGAWLAIVHGVVRFGHDLATKSSYICMCVCVCVCVYSGLYKLSVCFGNIFPF